MGEYGGGMCVCENIMAKTTTAKSKGKLGRHNHISFYKELASLMEKKLKVSKKKSNYSTEIYKENAAYQK